MRFSLPGGSVLRAVDVEDDWIENSTEVDSGAVYPVPLVGMQG